jgi:hypothetical protein
MLTVTLQITERQLRVLLRHVERILNSVVKLLGILLLLALL